MVDECFGGDFGVEGALVTEVTLPQFVDRIPDELSRGVLSRLEGSIIADKDGVFLFGSGADDRSGVVGNNGVCRWPGGDRERHTPSGGIRGRWFDDTDKVVRLSEIASCASHSCDAVEDEGYLVPFGWGNH